LIELRQLRNFLVVAEEENLRKAGERLHLDQSALSRGIRDLEEGLGFALFERLPRGFRLTNAGRAYAESIKAIFAELELAKQAGQRSSMGLRGSITVGISEICTHYPLVTGSFRQFLSDFSEAELKLVVLPSAQHLDAFARNELDASFFFGPPAELHRLQFETLLRDRVVLAVPHGHRLEKKREILLEDLSEERFIAHVLPSPYVYAEFKKRGFTPRVDLKVASIDAVISLVSAGIGVAFLAESLRHRAPADVQFRAIDDYEQPLILSLATPLASASPVLPRFVQTVQALKNQMAP